MRCTAFAFLAAAATAALFASSARGQNLFVNPSFETGDLTGWTITHTGSIYDGQHVATSAGVNVRSGDYALVGSPDWGAITIAQSVGVQPGQLYEISAWGSVRGNTGGDGGDLTIGNRPDNVVTTYLSFQANNPASNFVRVRRLYQAPAGQASAVIGFEGALGGTSSWDDFSMTPWTGALTPVTDSQRILTRGDAPPDGNGSVDGVSSVTINDAGTVLSAAASSSNGGYSTLLMVSRDRGGGQTIVARAGSPLTGGGTLPPSGWGYNGDVLPLGHVGLSPNGAATFSDDGGNGWNALYRADGDGITRVARLDDAAPGGGYFWGIQDIVTADAGTAFLGNLASTSSGGTGLNGIFYRPAGGDLSALVHDGDPAPGGGEFHIASPPLFDSRRSFDMNATGAYVFAAANSPSSVASIYVNTGSGPTLVPSSSLGDNPTINAGGDVAFETRFGAASGIKFHAAGTATTATLAALGQSAPGGSMFSSFSAPQLNDARQVAYVAGLADGTSGVFRVDVNGDIFCIARSTNAAPDGDGLFGTFIRSVSFKPPGPLPEPKLLAGGQVAFVASMNRAPGEEGVYLGDTKQVIPVTGWGHTIDGVAIAQLLWQNQQELSVNRFGQVAYAAELADGRSTSVLFTPTLHWRSAGSGNWSDSGNWTVGLAPAAVHPVVIDSPNGVTVTGPAGQTTIKSLSITSGNTLDLVAGSSIATTDGTTLDAGAFLRGSGSISGQVTNAGTISPGDSAGKITIAGDYQQSGRLELQLGDDGFDQLNITGDALLDGEIDVTGSALPGQSFDLITVAGALSGTPTWNLSGDGSSWKILDKPGIGRVFEVTYVPEPSAAFATVIGAIGLLIARRRKTDSTA